MDNPINPSTFNLVLEEYCNSPSLRKSRIRSDFKREIEIRNEYRGRELYELIQNADDEGASDLEIDLSDEKVIVRNNGKKFTDDGVMAILRSNESKKDSIRLIGQKGLGFRSVLNWAKEVEIQSAGYSFKFSETIAAEKWDEIKKRFSSEKDEADDLESLARSKNRNCPIPVLSIPQMKQIDQSDWTSVIISFKDESTKKSIETQIESLKKGCVLLFLRTLCRVKIGTEYLSRGEKNKDDVVSLNDRNWIVLTHEGRKDECDENTWYQVSVAYPEDGFIPENNCLYCFFPTWEPNPFSCVIHATLRLGQSRNSLNIDEMNEFLMGRCAELMYELAGRLKSSGGLGWKPLEVVYADCAVTGKYQRSLKENLVQKLLDSELFPTVVGGFVTGKEAHFISDELSNVVQRILGGEASCFSNMLIAPPREHYLEGIKEKKEWEYEEKEFVDQLNRLSDYMSRRDLPMDERARLIKAVVDGWPRGFGERKPRLLVDQGNSVIKGKGYLISRDQLPVVPDCVDLSYVSKDLYSRLCEEFGIGMGDDCEIRSERQPERVLWDRIQKFVDVTYADKNTIVRLIAPSSSDDESILERVRSLYEFYAMDVGKNDIVLTDTPIWLLNASGVPMESSKLVLFGDDLDKKWQLLDADEWGFKEIEAETLNAFWRKLHVSEFIPMDRVDVMADEQYLDFIELTGSSGGDKRANYTNKQYVFVPDRLFVEEYGNSHSLRSFLTLVLQETSLFKSIMSDQTLRYSYYGDQHREFPLSYPAYYTRRLAILKDLQSYVCGDVPLHSADVPSYEDVCHVRSDISRSEYNVFLGKLGAVDALSDLPAARLYDLLKDIPNRFPDGRGVPLRYEKLKAALATRRKTEKLVIPDDLKLLARDSKGMVCARRYDEVYYWDNDRYPKALVSNIPKLLMSSRAGEKTIQEVFGVKALSMIVTDVVILDDQSKRNTYLEDALIRHIRDRSSYILQVRNANVAINEVYAERLLAQLTDEGGIRCYERCAFTKGGVQDILGDNEMIPTREGDRVVYNICHKAGFDIHDPRFCESVVDVLSLKFGLSSENSEIMDDIRRVLQYTIPEIEYHFGGLVDETDVREGTDSEPADEELAFALEDFRQQRRVVFQYALWTYLSDKPDKQGMFIGLCKRYGENDWLKSVRTEPDMISISFNDHLKQLLGMDIVLDDQINAVLKEPLYDEYATTWPTIRAIDGKLGDSDEDNELKSYLYFSGNKQRIAPLIGKYLPASPAKTEQRFITDLSDYSQGVASLRKESGEGSTGGGEERAASDRAWHMRSRAVTVLSDERAVEIGENAEEIAAKLINASGGWAEIVSAANPIGGTNRHHYDIKYYKGLGREPKDCRYLEVKSMQQGSCELTKDEYDTGMKNAEKYDIAFLVGKTLYIFEAPFLDQQVREHLFKPSQYRIRECDLVLEKSSQKEPED